MTPRPSPDQPAAPKAAQSGNHDDRVRCWHCEWLLTLDTQTNNDQGPDGTSVCIDAWSCWLRAVSLQEHLGLITQSG